MKLEVGMYIRTDKGLIGKLVSKENYGHYGFKLEYKGQYNKMVWSILENDSEVVKASHSIIDLIEVGDYVNGYKVEQIDNGRLYFDAGDFTPNGIENYEIKTIFTHEVFEREVYKV